MFRLRHRFLRGGGNCRVGFVAADSKDGEPVFTIGCKEASKFSQLIKEASNSREEEDEDRDQWDEWGYENQDEKEDRTIVIRTNLSTRELRIVEECFTGDDFVLDQTWATSDLFDFLRRSTMLAMDRLELAILWRLWQRFDSIYDGGRQSSAKRRRDFNRIRTFLLKNGVAHPSPTFCGTFANILAEQAVPEGVVLRHLKSLHPPPLLVCWVAHANVAVTPKTRNERSDQSPARFDVIASHDFGGAQLLAVNGLTSFVRPIYRGADANGDDIMFTQTGFRVEHKGRTLVHERGLKLRGLAAAYSPCGSTVAVVCIQRSELSARARIAHTRVSEDAVCVFLIQLEPVQIRLFVQGKDFKSPIDATNTDALAVATSPTACVFADTANMTILHMARRKPVQVEFSASERLGAFAMNHGTVVAQIRSKSRHSKTYKFATFDVMNGARIAETELVTYSVGHMRFSPNGQNLVGAGKSHVWAYSLATRVLKEWRVDDDTPAPERLAYVTDSHAAWYRYGAYRGDIAVSGFFRDDPVQIVKVGFATLPLWMQPQSTDYYKSEGAKLLFDLQGEHEGDEDEDDEDDEDDTGEDEDEDEDDDDDDDDDDDE